MTAKIVKLPSASESYITVRKNLDFWDVVLATPSPGGALRTRLYSLSDEATAYQMGRKTAARIKRPFRAKGGAT